MTKTRTASALASAQALDGTLTAARPCPLCIGIGLQSTRIETIVPQPHDIPLHLIVTEAGPQSGSLPASGALPSTPRPV